MWCYNLCKKGGAQYLQGSDALGIFPYDHFMTTVNIGNLVKHKISNIAFAGKISCKNRTTMTDRGAAGFNTGASTRVSMRTIQQNISDMGFWS